MSITHHTHACTLSCSPEPPFPILFLDQKILLTRHTTLAPPPPRLPSSSSFFLLLLMPLLILFLCICISQTHTQEKGSTQAQVKSDAFPALIQFKPASRTNDLSTLIFISLLKWRCYVLVGYYYPNISTHTYFPSYIYFLLVVR